MNICRHFILRNKWVRCHNLSENKSFENSERRLWQNKIILRQTLGRVCLGPVEAFIKMATQPEIPDLSIYLEGVPKMSHGNVLSDLTFSTCVSESEFQARFIQSFKRYHFRIWTAIKMLKMRAQTFFPSQSCGVKLELWHFCTNSPNPICVGWHCYPKIMCCDALSCELELDCGGSALICLHFTMNSATVIKCVQRKL